MIDESDRRAIKILAECSEAVAVDDFIGGFDRFWVNKMLHHAIRHLAYPDRDIYPKVRGSKKRDPVIRGYW